MHHPLPSYCILKETLLLSSHPPEEVTFPSFEGDDLPMRAGLSTEERKQKKHLLQSPSSYFMDVKCPGCYKI